MQHLDDGFLHALADGEVPSAELGPVREHLEACDSCRARLDEARMEAEAARELIEFIEVPALIPAERRSGGAAEAPTRPTVQPSNRPQWMRPLAWAATLVLAAGIGYYGRGAAPFATAVQPVSVGRTDTVFLDVPPAVDPPRESDAIRDAGRDRASRPAELAATPPAQAARPAREDAQTEAAGARRDEETLSRRRVGKDSAIRLDQVVVTGAAAAAQPKTTETKEEASKAALQLAAPAAPSAEARLMARSAADVAAPVVVAFPRAVELLGGRIRLIEGMVPVRLEAVGRMVRVVYVMDEGELVLSQAAATDTLTWSLSGPLSTDSLARLRLRVR